MDETKAEETSPTEISNKAKASQAEASGWVCDVCDEVYATPRDRCGNCQGKVVPASDSPASRSMGWVADDLATIEESLEFYADRDSWRVPLDDSGNGLPAAEDEGKFAREALPALARLVKSLPPPPGQEAPATSPQDSRFANPKSEISPLAFVPHGEPCTLAECPPGPFVHEDTLAIKAWYGGCGWVFVDESGTELFGGTDTVEQKLQLTVQPVKLSAASSVEAGAEAVEAMRDLMRLYESKWSDEPDELVRARAILPKLKAQQQPATPSTSPTGIIRAAILKEAADVCMSQRMKWTHGWAREACVECAKAIDALAQQAPSIQTPDTKGDSPCR